MSDLKHKKSNRQVPLLKQIWNKRRVFQLVDKRV